MDPFAIIWAGPGFYRPHFTLVLVHKCQGEGTISYGPVTSGPSPSSCAWSCHGASGMVGLGRAGGGGRCPRNRRGNRATACNQNNGCGHDGGQCHNPRHPVFLHEPHWPPACAPGRPIQPDCPIKTVSGISQHRRQGQRRGWPISWMQHKERGGVPAHWDAPLIMPAGQLWRSISPGWHEQIGGHCFPSFVGQGGSTLLVSA